MKKGVLSIFCGSLNHGELMSPQLHYLLSRTVAWCRWLYHIVEQLPFLAQRCRYIYVGKLLSHFRFCAFLLHVPSSPCCASALEPTKGSEICRDKPRTWSRKPRRQEFNNIYLRKNILVYFKTNTVFSHFRTVILYCKCNITCCF